MPSRYDEDLAYIHHVGFGSLARDATPAVIEALRPVGANGTVLELGCGSGILLSALVAAGELVEQLSHAGFRVKVKRSYGTLKLGPGRLLFHCRRA